METLYVIIHSDKPLYDARSLKSMGSNHFAAALRRPRIEADFILEERTLNKGAEMIRCQRGLAVSVLVTVLVLLTRAAPTRVISTEARVPASSHLSALPRRNLRRILHL